MYDEYVYNAVALIPRLIDSVGKITDNDTSLHDSRVPFQSLHGYATTDYRQNVMMYFTLWDLDPDDGLFYPAMEQTDPPNGPLTVVRNRAIHWPGNGLAPAANYCAFFDCSTGISLHHHRRRRRGHSFIHSFIHSLTHSFT